MALTTAQKVRNFRRDYPTVEFINGKWFNKGQEIRNINKLLLTCDICRDTTDCNKFIDAYIAMYSDETMDKDWPQLKMVEEAINMPAPKELAYPLNDKELLILYYLLFEKSQYVVFFHGIGGSGKSTVLDIYRQIFDYEGANTTVMNLSDISHFNIQFANARLVLDDDASPNITENQSARLKSMATNGSASFEAKGRTPWSGQYRCKIVVAGNTPMKFNLTDEGMLRRIVYYSKNEKIKNPSSSFINKKYSRDELLGFIKRAYDLGSQYGEQWVKVFLDETRTTIMESNSVGKYGMSGNYATYENQCSVARITPFGLENYTKIYNLFSQWQKEKGNELRTGQLRQHLDF